MNGNKLKRYIHSKGIEPVTNRRKFGSILFAVTVCVFLLFICRFVYIVAVGKVGITSLDDKTRELYQGSSVLKAKRGSIYDRNGVPIAEDATSYSVYAVLDKNYEGLIDSKTKKREKLYVLDENKEAIAAVLNKQLKVKKEFALKQLNIKKNSEGNPQDQVEFGKEGNKISLETKTAIEKELAAQKIKGIYFKEHPHRVYPNGVFSSYLVGYVNFADEKDESKGLVGKMGIERAYNKELNGVDGKRLFQKDSQQKPLPGSIQVVKEPKNGKDIYLTLDSGLQYRLEELLDEAMESYGPEDITAMLVEGKTGNILAASQRPAFEPETLKGLDDKKAQWKNLLIEEPFEPGSTLKPFTVAAAIETGNFNPNATFLTGSWDVDDGRIADHNPDGIGTITYRQALAWSSNVGMVHLQQAMDLKWIDYLKRFGFAESTLSGLPGEELGNIQEATTVDRAMSAYGQAIAVTPFQMMQAFTSFTNEGKMLKLNYISKKVNTNGEEEKTSPQVIGEPITPGTAKQVLDMMVDVTEDAQFGTGYPTYQIDGYHVAAKTGTAQISEEGRYLDGQYLYSVVQIAPAENPEYIMYVTIRKPPEGSGKKPAEMLAEISSTLLKRALDQDITNLVEETSDK